MRVSINHNSGELILKAVSFFLLALLFIKAIFDVDATWDSWAYHLPLAAQMWGIVSVESFNSQSLQAIYDGFPLLCEFLQGFIWYISNRPELANLVCYFSLLLYIYFLNHYFKIPYYLSSIALLSVPLILIHTTTAYVDLPGNIAVSILIMMTFLQYTRESFINIFNFSLMIFAGAFAVNTKFLLAPVVFIALIFIGFKIVIDKKRGVSRYSDLNKWIVKKLPIAVLIILLIFAIPIKNLVVHGNPVYPMKIEVFGMPLNYKLTAQNPAPHYLKDSNSAVRWIFSLSEIGLRSLRHPKRWSADQWMQTDSKGFRMGGYFNFYVLFHLIVFIFLCYRVRRPTTYIAVYILILISIIAALSPQSHELRYYMYWMITLMSLNLYFITKYNSNLALNKWINHRNFGLCCLAVLLFVNINTRLKHAIPKFYSFNMLIEEKVDKKKTDNIKKHPDITIDITDKPWDFLYASEFHRPLMYLIRDGMVKSLQNIQEISVNKNKEDKVIKNFN
jgi:hypothetical protein